MNSGGKRKKSEDDPEYVPEDEQNEKSPSKKPRTIRGPAKRKATAADTPKPKEEQKEIKFNANDDAVLKTALMEFGNEYDKIAKRYFSNRPEISRIEIGNHCRNTEGLKQIVNSNTTSKKNEFMKAFNESVDLDKKVSKIVSQNFPTVEDVDSENNPPYPIALSNGRISVPSSNFLADIPFVEEGKNCYYVVTRYLFTFIFFFLKNKYNSSFY
jgi:hypothetical protein